MYLLYTLQEGSFEIKSIDVADSYEGAQILMYDVAKDFVLRENGETRAKDAYKFKVSELFGCDVPDGYHLEAAGDKIHVLQKTTKWVQGILFGATPVISISKILTFAIALLPNMKVRSILSSRIPLPQEKEHGQKVSYITELKDRLKTFKVLSVEEIEGKLLRSRED